MKKVLIAVDYDPTAQVVAEAGFEIAKAMNAAVLLVHVLSDIQYYLPDAYSPITGFGGYMDMSFPEPVVAGHLRDASLGFLDKMKAHLGDTGIETMVAEGDVADALLETAKDEGADVIVMGSHSRKWLEAVLMGSVTEKVLRQSIIPLFIVPNKK